MVSLPIAKLDEEADCLKSQSDIERAIDSLAVSINAFYQEQEITAICVLNGGIVITGMLLPKLLMPLRLDYIHVSRYQDQLQGDALEWIAGPQSQLDGRHILLMDDIFDEGNTMHCLDRVLMNEKRALTVKSVVLANKLHDRKAAGFQPDFIGFDVADRYVFGMGMDRKGLLRNAPAVYALKEE